MRNIIGNIYINKRGTIGRITSRKIGHADLYFMRRISPCSGKYSSIERKGKPYTFQSTVSIKSLKKNWELISVEKILRILFNNKGVLI